MNYKLLISFAILGSITYWSVTSRNEKDRKERIETFEASMRLGKALYENVILDQKEGIINFKKCDSVFEIRKNKMVKELSE
jgi:hypothetical protein